MRKKEEGETVKKESGGRRPRETATSQGLHKIDPRKMKALVHAEQSKSP